MNEKKIVQLSIYIALACVLQMGEMLIPTFIPGVKIGFANIITVIVLFKNSFKDALIVSVMRVIVTSLIVGTFLSPTFLLSFSGALASVLIMGSLVFFDFTRKNLSIIGISILGALTHNFAQFLVAYFLLIRHISFIWLLPFLMIGSLMSGIITGIIAKQVVRKTKDQRLKIMNKE